jgi:hypothetical protein
MGTLKFNEALGTVAPKWECSACAASEGLLETCIFMDSCLGIGGMDLSAKPEVLTSDMSIQIRSQMTRGR